MSTDELLTFNYQERRELVAASLHDWQVDGILVTNPTDLRYLIGFSGTTTLGPNPFTGGPSAALFIAQGRSILCLPGSDTGVLPVEADGLELADYPTFLELSPLYPRHSFAEAVVETLQRASLRRGKLGFQGVSLPVTVSTHIAERLPHLESRDLDEKISLLRMRKSEAEIRALRRSIALCDRAQKKVREMAQPGVRELDILAAVEQVIEEEAGRPLPFIHEISSGKRSGTIGSPASERELREGDLLLTDIAPQLDGYWGDSCASRVIGEPGGEKARMLRTVEEALLKGTEAVRPGVLTSEVDRLMREHVATTYPPYPNSGGHGIGLDYHEAPRLVPSEELRLDEGMVIALEPGVYLADVGGVRLEHLVLVTGDGCEVLSRHLGV